jgi:hypothetical protein
MRPRNSTNIRETVQNIKQNSNQYDLGELDSMKQQLDKNTNENGSKNVRLSIKETNSLK